jgi:FkbM family methyltransferase
MAVPRDGLGAQLFYEGGSEPDIEAFCAKFLRPGMVFFDIGAHVGKYTLLGAHTVGPAGTVHAFEPNPEISRLLDYNIGLNGLRNVRASRCAVSDTDGKGDFEVCTEASVSALLPRERRRVRGGVSMVVSVTTVQLDTYCAASGAKPSLVKVDTEGAEMPVFRGATALLDLPASDAPIWIFEHEPANYERFGYTSRMLIEFLRNHGYRVWSYREGSGAAILEGLPVPGGPANLLAAKEGVWLPSLL